MSSPDTINEIKQTDSLEQLQEYFRLMMIKRGFSKESAQDTLLVMVEEVGELAKALRKVSGIGIDNKRLAEYGNLQHEMADVLICLLILANKCNINLIQALQEKEKINCGRIWVRSENITAPN